MSPIIVSGSQFGGKSLLVESIIKILNKENDIFLDNTCPISFTVYNNFDDLFYKWNGQIRNQAVSIARENDSQITPYEAATSTEYSDEGFLVRLLKKEYRLQHLVIDYFDGNFESKKTDEYLARFLSNKEIYIGEAEENLSLREDKQILIFVIRHSYRESEKIANSATDKVIAGKFFHLTIPEPTVTDKIEILRYLHPDISDEFISDFSLFTNEFNKLPDLQKKVSLGEFIETAQMLIDCGQTELTTDTLTEHAESMVKNKPDYLNFTANAEKILNKIKKAKLSA